MLSSLLRIIGPDRRAKAVVLLMLMIVGAVLELVGLGAVVPIIALLAKPEVVESYGSLRSIYEALELRSPREMLMVAAFALLGVFAVKNAFLTYLLWYQSRFGVETQVGLAERLFRAYMLSPYAFHMRQNSAQLIRNINSEVDNFVQGVVIPLLVLVNETIVAAGILMLLLVAEPGTALITFLAVMAMAWALNSALKPVINSYGRARSRIGGEMNKWVIEGLGAIREAKVLGREEYFVRGHRDSAERYGHATLALTFVSGLPRLVIETFAVALVLGGILFLVWKGSSAPEIITVLGLFALAAMRLMPSATRVLTAMSSVRFHWPVVGAMLQAMKNSEQAESEASISPARAFQAIELKDVWFQYPGTETWALTAVSAVIRRGTSIALVGRSGSGKSTLAGLVLGLHAPTRGEVRLDGRVITSRDLRGIAGYVPQEPFVLDDTVRRNVAFGRPDEQVDDQWIWECLEQARLAEHVRVLKDGLDAPLGERGARFSGGERQRLAIARALYARPRLLVFDEPTSALDPHTEAEVSESIRRLGETMTVIVIAHRERTISACKEILLLEHGKILAQGSTNVLMEGLGPVRRLMREGGLEAAR